MTWTQVRDAASASTTAILPTGAIEAHGPHLPLETDGIIAEAMAAEGQRLLLQAGHQALLLPTLSYTAAGFAAEFSGTISLSPETVTAAIVDIGQALATAGIGVMAIANAHFDPMHQGSLRVAIDRLRDTPLRIVYPDLTRRPWALRLGEEFLSGACHAGCYESSVIIARRPQLVREAVRRQLEPNPASLSDAIRSGKTSFRAAGGDQAYFGDPAAATAQEGEATIATLGSILYEAVLQEL